jgi:D-glycero-D-manno-heptose 1,7-bisphosphate phosphatase
MPRAMSADRRTPRLALLDRDGTLNVKAPDGEYILSPADLVMLPGAAAAVARLNAAGIPVALITNQRAIARGLMSQGDLEAVHARLAEALAAEGAHLDAVFVCPHGHDACACRKPQPGMLLEALARFGTEPADAVMVGDAGSDVEAGRRAAVRTIQIVPAGAESAADATAVSLERAVADLIG